MKIIVITLPEPEVKNEAERITAMLESDVIDRIHLRKPEIPINAMRELISSIPPALYCRLSLHSHPELLQQYPEIGWHFSATRPDSKCRGLHSRSCHFPLEAAQWAGECDYVTLSPVFDSISKPGYYSARFNPVEEYLCNQHGMVVALGGVTPNRIPRLKERGYQGAAMLGHAWQTELTKLIEELKCYNS